MNHNVTHHQEFVNTVKKLFYDDHGNYPTRRVTVVSIQIEVVSIHMESRFATHLKWIRYKLKSFRYSLYLPKL